jgi:hypothetical protein
VTLDRQLFSDASWKKLETGEACLLVEVADDSVWFLPTCRSIKLDVDCQRPEARP